MSKKKTFCFDIDGIIATLVHDNQYNNAQPKTETIQLINQLYESGHHITLFTARGSKTGIDWSDVTQKQMIEWGVKHHELHFGKPAADYYIDDRSMSPAFLPHLIKDLNQLGDTSHD